MNVVKARDRKVERGSSGTGTESDGLYTFIHFVLVADGHDEEARATVFVIDDEPGHNQSYLRNTEGWSGSRHESISKWLRSCSRTRKGYILACLFARGIDDEALGSLRSCCLNVECI